MKCHCKSDRAKPRWNSKKNRNTWHPILKAMWVPKEWNMRCDSSSHVPYTCCWTTSSTRVDTGYSSCYPTKVGNMLNIVFPRRKPTSGRILSLKWCWINRLNGSPEYSLTVVYLCPTSCTLPLTYLAITHPIHRRRHTCVKDSAARPN